MSVTCLFGKCKALFLSTAQAAPKQTIRQKQYNINTPFTSTNNKHARKGDRKSTRLNSSHSGESRMPSSA